MSALDGGPFAGPEPRHESVAFDGNGRSLVRSRNASSIDRLETDGRRPLVTGFFDEFARARRPTVHFRNNSRELLAR